MGCKLVSDEHCNNLFYVFNFGLICAWNTASLALSSDYNFSRNESQPKVATLRSLVCMTCARNKNRSSQGLKLFKQWTLQQSFYFYNLVLVFAWHMAKLKRLVGWKFGRNNAHENVAPLRPLLGLVFVCIMNRSQYSVVGKDFIFKISMNIRRTVDCIRGRRRPIGKPTFDLW